MLSVKSAQTVDDVPSHRYLIQQSPNSAYHTRKWRLWAAAVGGLVLDHLNSRHRKHRDQKTQKAKERLIHIKPQRCSVLQLLLLS